MCAGGYRARSACRQRICGFAMPRTDHVHDAVASIKKPIFRIHTDRVGACLIGRISKNRIVVRKTDAVVPESTPESAPVRKQQAVPDKQSSIRALNCLNFFLADVQGGVGPFLVVFLTATLHWEPSRIGFVMGAAGVVGVVAQIPAGAMIDQLRHKRRIVATAATLIALGSVGIAFFPTFAVVLAGQSFIGIAGAVFGPAIAAITLGLVGRAALDRQIGRNQSINSTGNVVNALLVGFVGAMFDGKGMFFYVAVISVATVVSVGMIRADDIDYALARGADNSNEGCQDPQQAPATGEKGEQENTIHPEGMSALLRDRRILIFAVSCILFHFANAGMGPLVSELLARGAGERGGLRFMSASVIVAQCAIIPLGVLIGRRAEVSRRKPLYLIPFCLLPLRALLYTVNHGAYFLVGMELLDGSAMGIFGIMQLLVIADLTRGTGRFNLTQGALSTAVGIGASSSNFVAGWVVKLAGFNAGFLTMAGIAGAALVFFWWMMPETQEGRAPGNARSRERLSAEQAA
jgi:MFS family permease